MDRCSNFICNDCDQKFKHKSSLLRHVNKIHLKTVVQHNDRFNLLSVLPDNDAYQYTILSTDEENRPDQFKLKFKIRMKNPSVSVTDLRNWIDSFSKIHNCKYTRRCSRKRSSSSGTTYSELYYCEHYHKKKDQNRKKKVKGTECKSVIYASLDKDQNVQISVNFNHNHSRTTNAEALRVRSRQQPSADVQDVFLRISEDGMITEENVAAVECVSMMEAESEYKRNAINNFINEARNFVDKFSYSDEFVEALTFVSSEFIALTTNGRVSNAISALKCFNRCQP